MDVARVPIRSREGFPPERRALLEFERAWPVGSGSKGRAIRERFGISPTRYHQLLDRAIDQPDALADEPALVRRLRRLRDVRRRVRSHAPFGSARLPG